MTRAVGFPGVPCAACGQRHVGYWHGQVIGQCQLSDEDAREIAREKRDDRARDYQTNWEDEE